MFHNYSRGRYGNNCLIMDLSILFVKPHQLCNRHQFQYHRNQLYHMAKDRLLNLNHILVWESSFCPNLNIERHPYIFSESILLWNLIDHNLFNLEGRIDPSLRLCNREKAKMFKLFYQLRDFWIKQLILHIWNHILSSRHLLLWRWQGVN